MPRFLLLCFIFICQLVYAQPRLQSHYSSFDTCPTPARYHIATRTVYTAYLAKSENTTGDSVIETYDHYGNLLQVKEFTIINRTGGGFVNSENYFRFDELHRLIYDSIVFSNQSPGSHNVATFEYDTIQRCVVEDADMFGSRYRRCVYYGKHDEIIADYNIEGRNDTMSRSEQHGDTMVTAQRSRDSDGKLSTWSYYYTVTTKTRVVDYSDYYLNAKYFDQAGVLRNTSMWQGHALYDSTHYVYDSIGQLIAIKDMSIGLLDDEPDNYVTHTQYSYDQNGHLIEEQSWTDYERTRITYTRYQYNERGLLIEKKITQKAGAGEERLLRRDVWKYTYW